MSEATLQMAVDLAQLNAQHATMLKAFKLVENPVDWKAPIRAIVTVETLTAQHLTIEQVLEAVVYFTATNPRLVPLLGCYRVESIGYRAGPAGP